MVKQKNNKILIFGAIIFVIAIILIIFGCYLQKQKSFKENDAKLKVLDINSKLVNELMNKIFPEELIFPLKRTIELNSDTENNYIQYFGIYYSQDKLLATELPENLKMALTIRNIEEKSFVAGYEGESSVSESRFKESYHEIFGKKANYQFLGYDFETETKLAPIRQEDTRIILSDFNNGIGEEYQIHNKIVKAEKLNKEVHIYERVAFLKQINSDESSNTDLYSDLEYNNLIAESITDKDIFSNIYINKLLQFKYTFKLEGNNYYFYSIEKLNTITDDNNSINIQTQ